MATRCALAEDHQRARHDVGAFHRYRYRCGTITATDNVVRALHHTGAGGDIHCVNADLACYLGGIGFHDRGGDRRLDALVNCRATEYPCRLEAVTDAAHLADFRLDAFHDADRDAELLSHHRVSTGYGSGNAHGTDAGGGQGDHAPTGQRFHQHLPALADIVRATKHIFRRHDHVAADDRAVLEIFSNRVVVITDMQAFGTRRTFFQQHYGDAGILALA